ncbi:hypothetical protein FRC10_008483 [Ceratobasidium sp. 414]|nr:hypothetical protein FRC10_008483 [Ceratobasidium sp. 414]
MIERSIKTSSPLDGTSNVYSEVFNRWESVYGLLVSTLDSFAVECTNLDLALQKSSAGKWPEQLEKSLISVDAAFTSLESCHSKIRGARTTLGRARNRSRTLVPLNKLPAEIIAHISALTDASSIIDPQYDGLYSDPLPPPLLSLSVVNRHLRDILTSAPSAWSHLNLVIDKPQTTHLCYARSCLKYSRHLPLHVRIAGGITGQEGNPTNLLRLLAPHAHRVVSLNLQVSLYWAGEVVRDLFSKSSSCQVRELYINNSTSDPEGRGSRWILRHIFEGDLDGLLQPLEVLGIRGFYMPFNAPGYRGLTVLRLAPFGLEHPTPPPTLLQLRDVLAACPELCTLTLMSCNFDTGPGAPIEPVFLPKLRVLDLRTTLGEELMAVISCITLGSNPLAFSVSLDPEMPEVGMTGLQQFIKQSKVTRLCIDAVPVYILKKSKLDWLLASPPDGFPSIQELALCSYEFEGSQIRQPLGADRFPSLWRLHFMGCRGLNPDICRQILEASAVRVVQRDQKHVAPRSDLSGIALPVGNRRYSALCSGEGDLEWPLYV